MCYWSIEIEWFKKTKNKINFIMLGISWMALFVFHLLHFMHKRWQSASTQINLNYTSALFIFLSSVKLCSLSLDICSADLGGSRFSHWSLHLVWGDWLQGLVSVWWQQLWCLLQGLPQLLGIHHCPQHHGAHFSICQVS